MRRRRPRRLFRRHRRPIAAALAGLAAVAAPTSEPDDAEYRRVLVRRTLELAPQHASARRLLADVLSWGKNYRDALALFPASPMKQALEEAVEFCTARTH